MNDFTKEELEDIYSAVIDTCIAMLHHLPSKIQSMIDNYCQHTWFFYLSSKGSALKCHKCNKEINGDNQ